MKVPKRGRGRGGGGSRHARSQGSSRIGGNGGRHGSGNRGEVNSQTNKKQLKKER